MEYTMEYNNQIRDEVIGKVKEFANKTGFGFEVSFPGSLIYKIKLISKDKKEISAKITEELLKDAEFDIVDVLLVKMADQII